MLVAMEKSLRRYSGGRGTTRLKMTSGKLLPEGDNAVSHLTQSELPTARPTSAPCLHALPPWQIVVLAALSLWLYGPTLRSEEHTSELQSPLNLLFRLPLEKKNTRLT